MRKIVIERKSLFYNSSCTEYIFTDKQWEKLCSITANRDIDLSEFGCMIENKATKILEIDNDVKKLFFMGTEIQTLILPSGNNDVYYVIHTKGKHDIIERNSEK